MSMRNMVAMFGAMAALRRVDQEEPIVLLYSRIGYLCYVAISSLVYVILHFRIIARRDTTLITVPLSAKSPSFSEALEQARQAADKADEERSNRESEDAPDDQSTTSTQVADNSANGASDAPANDAEPNDDADDADEAPEKTETITVMEYDLRHLANSRRSWVTSACFLGVVHYHMQSVSPLVMSALMGILRLVTEDPLFQIHICGAPCLGKLKRPFTPEKNPLAAMMKDFTGKDDRPAEATTTHTSRPEEDLHDDGDDDDDDDAPQAVTDIRDDHIKSDFDDDDSGESKKTQ